MSSFKIRMEAGDHSISLDLIIRGFLYFGVKSRALAPIIDSFEPTNYAGSSTSDLVGEESESDKLFKGWQEAVEE